MQEMGYGKDLEYPHDHPGHFVNQPYLPDGTSSRRFYNPSDQGAEQQAADRIRELWPERESEPEETGEDVQ